MTPFGRAPTAEMCSCKGHPVACWYILTAWEFNNEESDLITLLSAGRLPSIPWCVGGAEGGWRAETKKKRTSGKVCVGAERIKITSAM